MKSLFVEQSRKGFPNEPLLAATQTMGVVRKDRYGTRTVTAEKDLHLLKLANINDFVISLRSFEGGIEVCHDRGIISPAYTILTAKNPLLVGFLSIFFKSNPFVEGLKIFVTGIRDGQNINYASLSRSYLAVPPFSEQHAIVKFVRHVEREVGSAVAAKRRLIGLLAEQKRVIIHQIVTGDSTSDTTGQNTGISGIEYIPSHWELPPLKAVASIQTGITLGKNYADQRVQEFPYLRVANVQAGRLDLSSIATLYVPKDEAARSTLRPGDVLMTEGGDPDKLGRGCVWNGEIANCLHQNHVFSVRPRTNLNPHFLEAVLGTLYAQTYFRVTAKQTTNLASTNKTKIGAFRVPLPPLEEQLTILAAIKSSANPLDTAIRRAEREIALLREYQTRLTADVVTGKLDVREAAAALTDLAPYDPDLSLGEADEGGQAMDVDPEGEGTTEESM